MGGEEKRVEMGGEGEKEIRERMGGEERKKREGKRGEKGKER